MPISTSKIAPGGEPTLQEFDAGVAHLSDDSTIEFPKSGFKVIEQDPTKPPVHPMYANPAKPGVLIRLDNGTEFFLIRGATRQTLLNAVERIKRQM